MASPGRRVFVRGWGMTPVQNPKTLSAPLSAAYSPTAHLVDLSRRAVDDALTAARIPPERVTGMVVGNMLAPVLQRQSQVSTVIASKLGFHDIDTWTMDSACASGGMALRSGVSAVLSGAHDVVLVLGVEAMSGFPGAALSSALAQASDVEKEASKGETFLSLNDKLTHLYHERHEVPRDGLFAFARNAHRNATGTPHALFRDKGEPSLEAYESAGILPGTTRLRLQDACPTCSGAAALILSSDGVLGQDPIVAASDSRNDVACVTDRSDPLSLTALNRSTKTCLDKSGVSLQDISLYEVHDAYSVMAALCLEASGFCAPGEGWRWGRDGRIQRKGGEIPISTFGGLKARGHPVGASGVYSVAEICAQLTERAGPAHQIGFREGRAGRHGLTTSFGGAATTVVTHIVSL